MSISDTLAKRGITEALHFTTDTGLTGIFASKALKARSRLSVDKYLEHIYKPNCPSRDRDIDWHDYVNLSLTDINANLFNISSGNWHADISGWWCIIAFDCEILSHDNVVFCTTNNMYSGVMRARGVAGLEMLFAKSITRWRGNVVTRGIHLRENQTTCDQAEVLYPGELPLRHLKRIYVRDAEHADAIAGAAEGCGCELPECLVMPSIFKGR